MTPVRTRACDHCQKPYLVPVQKGNMNRYCSALCRRLAGRVRRRKDGTRVYDYDLTPLNIATTMRYLECAGQHVESGRFVKRELWAEERLLPICANCEVPIRGKWTVWNGKTARDMDYEDEVA